MILIVINSKGGVSKSTTSSQILAAYLYKRNNEPCTLIEVDDENQDSVIFSETKIFKQRSIATAKIKELDEVFISDEDTIIDVGGNKTATLFLREMQLQGEFENVFWFIPVQQGIQDNANALDTYSFIKKLDEEAKVMFVLSNSRTENINSKEDIHWEYMFYFGNEFLDTSLAICNQVENPNHIVIKSSEVINNSKTFMKTVLDIASNTVDFRQKAKDTKDQDRRKFLFLNRVKNESIQYIKNLEKDVFPLIDIFTSGKSEV